LPDALKETDEETATLEVLGVTETDFREGVVPPPGLVVLEQAGITSVAAAKIRIAVMRRTVVPPTSTLVITTPEPSARGGRSVSILH